MRIVYICDFFHPDAGYHPNLLSKYWSKFGNEVYMLTSELEKMPESLTHFFDCSDMEEKDKKYERDYGVKIYRCPIYRFVSGRSVYKKEIFNLIKKLNPDVVYVNGNDTLIGIQLTMQYNKNPFGLVMDSHMLEIASSNSRSKILFRDNYRRFVAPRVIKNRIPVIRAQNSDYVEKWLGIPLKQAPWISFGSDMLLFHPDLQKKGELREKNSIPLDAFVIIYAGKINNTKGMDLFARAIRNRLQTDKTIHFIIVGSTEGEEGREIEDELRKSENPITRFPTQRYSDLPGFYQMADLAVFPKQCSLSFFDVQACALPVVFEDNEINIDRSKNHNAVVFKTNDDNSLRSAIESFANMNREDFENYKSNAIEYVKRTYNYEDKAKEYMPFLEAQAKAKGRI